MTYHSRLREWTLKDELTEEVISDIVQGVSYHGFQMPMAYWIGSQIDQLITHFGARISQNVSMKDYKKDLDDNPENDGQNEIKTKLCTIYEKLWEAKNETIQKDSTRI